MSEGVASDDAAVAEPCAAPAPDEDADIATTNECVDSPESTMNSVSVSANDVGNSKNCLGNEDTDTDRPAETSDVCKESSMTITAMKGDEIMGETEQESKIMIDDQTNPLTTTDQLCIDLTETKCPQVDPSVAHILDFTSDGYANNYKEITDSNQIPARNLMRKRFVLPPDPRPLLGCTWCSSSCDANLSQINGLICPGCKYFADQGWERVYLKHSSKITFTRPDGPTMASVKAFLQESSKILSPMLGGEANDFIIQTSKGSMRQTERKTKVAKKSQALKTPERSPSTRKKTTTERYTHEVKKKPSETKAKSSKAETKATQKAQNVNVEPQSSADSTCKTTYSYTAMTTRKAFVCAQDPRPVLGCEWCGPEKAASHICESCQIFVDLGMTRDNNKKCKKCYFYDKNGKRKYMSTKEYLIDTTKYFSEKREKGASKTKAPTKKGTNGKKRVMKSTTSQKKVVSTPSEKREESNANESVQSRKKPVSIELPTLTQLLEQEHGLMGVLQEDKFEVFHTHFGSNQTIACKILICLGNAKLPLCVFEETPFMQTTTSDSMSTQFIGAVRSSDTNSSEMKYGVAIPQFYVDYDISQESSIKIKNYIIPQVTTVKGQTLLLRNDLDDEKVAGQLFAFMYRVMYGSSMLRSAILGCNGPSQSTEPKHDIIDSTVGTNVPDDNI